MSWGGMCSNNGLIICGERMPRLLELVILLSKT